jgi:multidrug efflux pump subunit AcrA (membrane-fusion protein)
VAVVVPVSAVFSPEDVAQSFVWIIDQQDKTVARREVKVGELTSRGLQILDGLAPGELIATAGVHYLREGQPVRPLEPDSK